MHKVRTASIDDVMKAVGAPTINEVQAAAVKAEFDAKQALIDRAKHAEKASADAEKSRRWHMANHARKHRK
jgi:hypothetical protein